ncbi:zinc ribbon domain-containing protein [Convivina intestini]|uniref:Putative membrane protein YvbJ n=1 Tax=Convivina intestini TaxID=1505726 RepID=A0A2U1DBG1_9LACO|nr:hypothetical protein [Convivina intestini]PVY85001.1 putative membrane protein YvbJ [Convivina intestini]CAH1853363.1 hypothetical protein R077811_00674 [Convivina intestini]SDB89475.1 Uncharacterized membrane protein YvbJ [Leuconostocaceae bacterium R-53105]
MDKKQWLDNFIKENGRQPSPEEFIQAKNNGFKSEKPQKNSTDNQQLKEWVATFTKENGRQPSIDEVQGHKNGLDQPRAKAVAIPSTKPAKTVKKVTRTQPKSKKQLVIWTTGIVLALALLGGIGFGYHYYSYDASYQRALKLLASHNPAEYQKMASWSDSNKKLTKDELKPLADYVADKQLNQSELKSLLKNDSAGVSFAQDGSNWLLFPRYVIKLQPVNLRVTTNQSNLKVTVNGQTLTSDTDSSYEKLIRHQAPGLYSFTAQGSLNGRTVKTSVNNYFGGRTTESVDLDIETLSFTVRSNLNDAKVYVGDTAVGTIVDGKANLTDIPVSSGAEVYVKKTSNGNKVESSHKKLSSISNGDEITLNAKGMLTNDDAQKTLATMADVLTYYAHKEKNSSDVSSAFLDGTSNHAYRDFCEMIDHNLHSAKRNADDIDFGDVKVKNVDSTGKNKADVTFEIQEDFNYSSKTDSDKQSSGRLRQRYLLIAHMAYDSDSKKWLVESIDSNQKKLSESDDVR